MAIKRRIYKCSLWLFENFFWVTTISALLGLMFGFKQYLISALLPSAYIACALISIKKIRFNIFDAFVFAILIDDVVSWLINSYPYRSTLAFRHILGPVAYMMVYFIGRTLPAERVYSVFERSMLPALLVSIVGIYCFFFPPSWYYGTMSDGLYAGLEALRLHSIFSSPYQLAYMLAFLLSYILFRIFQYDESWKLYRWYVIVFVITMAFCMMRAPMAGVLIALAMSLLYTSIVRGKVKVMLYGIGGILIVCGILLVVLKSTNAEYVDFLIDKFDFLSGEDDDFVERRYDLMEAKVSILGDGAGRHNIWADDYVLGTSLRDGEYQKLLQEVGIVGRFLYVCFFVFAILKCMINYRSLLFEFSMISFLLISMIGACSLSTVDKSPMLFWLVIGRVAAFKSSKKKNPYNVERVNGTQIIENQS